MTFKLSSSILEGDSARAEELQSARLAGKRAGFASWQPWKVKLDGFVAEREAKSFVQCHLMFGEAGRFNMCMGGLCKYQHIVEYFKPHIDPITT